LVDVNATASILGSTLTAAAIETFTFSSSFSVPDGDILWIVCERSATLSDVNYYTFWYDGFTAKTEIPLFEFTSSWAEVSDIRPYYEFDGATNLATKTDTDYFNSVLFYGFVESVGANRSVTVKVDGTDENQSGLALSRYYYLNGSGISLNPAGEAINPIGFSVSETQLKIQSPRTDQMVVIQGDRASGYSGTVDYTHNLGRRARIVQVVNNLISVSGASPGGIMGEVNEVDFFPGVPIELYGGSTYDCRITAFTNINKNTFRLTFVSGGGNPGNILRFQLFVFA